MKKSILALTITAFMLSIVQTSIAAPITEKKDAGYISLSASKDKEVDPNVARITFAVENTAEDAKKAIEENNVLSNQIMQTLKTLTIEGIDQIKTAQISVRPVYKTFNGKRTIKNYIAVNSVNVETKDVKKVAKYIDAAIANGANRVDGLNYSYENDKSVCTELYPEVIKELKKQASTMALAAGTSIDGLKHMNASCNMDNAVSSRRYYAKNAALDSVSEESTTTTVEVGKIKVRVFVNADFYVK